MLREAVAEANTLEEATELACEKLNADVIDCTIEVLQTPKKGLFGNMKQKAKVKATIEEEENEQLKEKEDKKPETSVKEESLKKSPVVEASEDIKKKIETAKQFLTDVFAQMNLVDIDISFETEENAIVRISITGEKIGMIIGKGGETLDAIQYLVSLVANRLGGEYVRFTINAGNYREKREETLKNLAQRIAKKVLRSGRPSALEPMNPYERRIIHSIITDIEGVYSKSTGEEPNRKVVIKPSGKSYRGKQENRYNRKDDYKKTVDFENNEKSAENKAVESVALDDNVKLYSKIEL